MQILRWPIAKVDPYVQQIPTTLIDVKTGQLTPEGKSWFDYDDIWKHNMWKRSGGGDDLIKNIQNIENDQFIQVDQFHQRADDNAQIEDLIPLRLPDWRATIQNSSYTAVNYDWVEARSNAIIKLDEQSDNIIVANGDGTSITVDAQTLKIKYTISDFKLIMRRQGTSFRFKKFYDAADQYWRVI